MDMFAALRAFVGVIDAGGFTAAGRQAGQAASSLTRQVDALEAHLGTRLLNRSTRGLTLTTAGEAYYPRAQAILTELDEAGRALGETADGPVRGLLRVSLPVAFARLHVSPFIPGFMARYPDVELDLEVTDRRASIVEQRIDLAIRLGPLESSSLIARRLAPHRRVVCASPAYLAARGVPRVPADLADHACLAFAFPDGHRRWQFFRDGQSEAHAVTGPLRAGEVEALKQAAVAGFGLVLMPSWLVGQDVGQGLLRPVLTDWRAEIARPAGMPTPEGEPGIHALCLPGRRNAPKVRAFVDYLASAYGAPPYWERAMEGAADSETVA